MDTLEAGQCNRPPQMTVALDSCTIQFLAKEINMQQEITANGVAFLELCKNGVKVQLEVCKLSDGTIMYTPSDGSAVITGSIVDVFAAGYTVECQPIQCVCTEMHFVLAEGDTVNYQNLLSDFEANGTFDDGSKGAAGINEVDFGNLNKQGMSFTYNGKSRNNIGGSFHFGDGDDNNDISNDLSITSNNGDTTITYVVYKCV